MGAQIFTSKDVVASFEDPVEYATGSYYLDAILDGTDILWVARSDSVQTEISYTSVLYADSMDPTIIGKCDGGPGVWLKCPEGTVYLFCGGKSFQLDTYNRTLLDDTFLTRLASSKVYFTWAWRGDELWIASDTSEGIYIAYTRDRGRTDFTTITGPDPTGPPGFPRHPRILIAHTGEMVVIWWRNGSLEGAVTRDYTNWTALPEFQAVGEQWVGGLWLDQKVVISYVDNGGTVQRIECDSLNDTPMWG